MDKITKTIDENLQKIISLLENRKNADGIYEGLSDMSAVALLFAASEIEKDIDKGGK